jgi:hypothetical protein
LWRRYVVRKSSSGGKKRRRASKPAQSADEIGAAIDLMTDSGGGPPEEDLPPLPEGAAEAEIDEEMEREASDAADDDSKGRRGKGGRRQGWVYFKTLEKAMRALEKLNNELMEHELSCRALDEARARGLPFEELPKVSGVSPRYAQQKTQSIRAWIDGWKHQDDLAFKERQAARDFELKERGLAAEKRVKELEQELEVMEKLIEENRESLISWHEKRQGAGQQS